MLSVITVLLIFPCDAVDDVVACVSVAAELFEAVDCCTGRSSQIAVGVVAKLQVPCNDVVVAELL